MEVSAWGHRVVGLRLSLLFGVVVVVQGSRNAVGNRSPRIDYSRNQVAEVRARQQSKTKVTFPVWVMQGWRSCPPIPPIQCLLFDVMSMLKREAHRPMTENNCWFGECCQKSSRFRLVKWTVAIHAATVLCSERPLLPSWWFSSRGNIE